MGPARTTEHVLAQEPGAPDRAPHASRPVAIEARGLDKTFRIPTHRIDSLKERMVRPFARADYRELCALRDVSFDVHRGEFFGIVGRNGSGKSTLLKIMASIYRADQGRMRMAGVTAPFIELGVGFNPDLTARENVVLNGVMMGLSRAEARRRVDAVLEFGELERFADMKLKNYSSGMMVRLGFSVMIQSDADILLVDEVLAVGDAAFQQKCSDVFHDMKDAGRTIVLVTHDMTAVQRYCHRAMLLEQGERMYIGDPDEAGRRYLQLNFGGDSAGREERGGVPDLHTRLVDSWLEDAAGQRIDNVEAGEPIRINAVVEATTDLVSPAFAFVCSNEDGVRVFSFRRQLTRDEQQPDLIENGHRIRISGTIENVLVPGRYVLRCLITRGRNTADLAAQALTLLDFVVYGRREGSGLVAVEADVDAVREES